MLIKKESPKEVEKTNQEIADELRNQGIEEIKTKNNYQAIKIFEQAALYAPKDARIKANICVALWNCQDYSQCLEAVQQLIYEKEIEKKNEKMICSMMKKGINSALKIKKYDIAIQLATLAVKDFPENETFELLKKAKLQKENFLNKNSLTDIILS